MVEFIKSFKEKQRTRQYAAITQQAEDTIYLSDFNDKMYISVGGNPLVEIEDTWTTKEIMEEIKKLRNNFITVKLKKQFIG